MMEEYETFSDVPGKSDPYPSGMPPSVSVVEKSHFPYKVTDHCRIDFKHDHARGLHANIIYGIDRETPPNFTVQNRDFNVDDMLAGFIALAKGDKSTASRLIAKASCNDCPDVTLVRTQVHSSDLHKRIGKAEWEFLESSYFKQLHSIERIVVVNPTLKFVTKMKTINLPLEIVLSEEQKDVQKRESDLIEHLKFIELKSVVSVKTRQAISKMDAVKFLQNQVDYMQYLDTRVICFEVNPYSPSVQRCDIEGIVETETQITFASSLGYHNSYWKEPKALRVSDTYLRKVWSDYPEGINMYLPTCVDERGGMGNYSGMKLEVQMRVTPMYDVYSCSVKTETIKKKEVSGTVCHVGESSINKGKEVIVSICDSRPVFDQIKDIGKLTVINSMEKSWKKRNHGDIYCTPSSEIFVTPFDVIKEKLTFGYKSRFIKVKDPKGEKVMIGVGDNAAYRVHGHFGTYRVKDKRKEDFFKPDKNGPYIFRYFGIEIEGCPTNPEGGSIVEPLPLWGIFRGGIKHSGKNYDITYDLPHEMVTKTVDIVMSSKEIETQYNEPRRKEAELLTKILEIKSKKIGAIFCQDVEGCDRARITRMIEKAKVRYEYQDEKNVKISFRP